MNVFDGGLVLTLGRFTGLTKLPYRDLWTLYGPGPAVYGSVVSRLFGPGLLASRIADLMVLGLLVFAVHALCRRYVPWWWAATFAAGVATLGSQYHFTHALVLVLWGIWFIVTAEDLGTTASRRVTLGAFLIGVSFWGRYEFAVIAAALVLVVWWYVRPRLSSSSQRLMLVAGLGPLVLFGVYLLVVVGWDRAYFNLIDYPLRYYAKPYCRGGASVWVPAAEALLIPFRGRAWTPDELTLWAGTFVPPVAGIAVLVASVRRWSARSFATAAMLAMALLTLFVWLDHRPRAGFAPHPNWPTLLICIAMLSSLIAGKKPRAATGLCLVAGVLMVSTICFSWLPDRLRAWRDWPPYHPKYGFAEGEQSGLYDQAVWSELIEVVDRHAHPGEEIFVALTENGSHFANAPLFYWLVDRPPASRFFEFDPCLTDRAIVQRRIVSDLTDTDVLITTTFFPRPRPPALGPPPTVLDAYLRAHFHRVYGGGLPGDQAVFVLVRQPVGDPH